jgi:hypothetical protein
MTETKPFSREDRASHEEIRQFVTEVRNTYENEHKSEPETGPTEYYQSVRCTTHLPLF